MADAGNGGEASPTAPITAGEIEVVGLTTCISDIVRAVVPFMFGSPAGHLEAAMAHLDPLRPRRGMTPGARGIDAKDHGHPRQLAVLDQQSQPCFDRGRLVAAGRHQGDRPRRGRRGARAVRASAVRSAGA